MDTTPPAYVKVKARLSRRLAGENILRWLLSFLFCLGLTTGFQISHCPGGQRRELSKEKWPAELFGCPEKQGHTLLQSCTVRWPGPVGDFPATRYFPAGTSELTEPPGEAQTEEEPSGHQGGSYCSSAPAGFQVVGTVLSSFKDMIGQ